MPSKGKKSTKKAAQKDKAMTEMEVVGVTPEQNSGRPVVWLKGKDQEIFLPIAIGPFEANAICMALYNEPPPRPITYDLLRSILDGVKIQINQVRIHAWREGTFYGEIALSQGRKRLVVDARPSDGIALALRVGAPIFSADEVLEAVGVKKMAEKTTKK